MHTSKRTYRARLEPLEPKRLLAANLIAHFRASDLVGQAVSGQTVDRWVDSVAAISASAFGDPQWVDGALNGQPVMRFQPQDGIDRFQISSLDSPVSGAERFSVAVVFATRSQNLAGEGSHWFFHAGLVDAHALGMVEDWGLAITPSGQITAGLGSPAKTLFSPADSLNDGLAHVAILSRDANRLALYVDQWQVTRDDVSARPRDARAVRIGSGGNPFEGDIAEVRFYDAALSDQEAEVLIRTLSDMYINFPPHAQDDVYSVDEDGVLIVPASDGLLTNDVDPESDAMTVHLERSPEHGVLDLSADGAVVYRPAADFFGVDRFTYRSFDPQASNEATVTIDVRPIYDPVSATPDRYVAVAGRTVYAPAAIGVLANDSNPDRLPLEARRTADAEHGTLEFHEDGSFRYTPHDGFVGTDRFSYEVSDTNTTITGVIQIFVQFQSVVMSELVASNRTTLDDEDGDSSDWLELYNFGSEPVDVTGWFLTDSRRDLAQWPIPTLVLGPQARQVVFASGKDRRDPAGELHTNFKLDASGEFLALVGPDGRSMVSQFDPGYPPQVRDVSYGVRGSESVGEGIARFDFAYLRQPTPGAANVADTAPPGPIVRNVQHRPNQPSAGQDVVVSAAVTVIDAPVDQVALYYRLMYGPERSRLMTDDGSVAGDIAGDGIYTAIVPAADYQQAWLDQEQAITDLPGKMLRYRIESTDQTGRTFPAPYLADRQNTLGHDEYFGTVFQTAVDTRLPVFHWFVPDPDWHKLPNGNNTTRWSPASVFFDGEFYDNLRVRVRGITTVNWTKPKLKFEFNPGHDFRYSRHAHRVDEFNLQSHYVEKGATSYMGENLAFSFLQDIGVPAPNTFHMHVRQNGMFYALASFVEQIDSTFLERNGLDPYGAMYKANSPAARSTLAPRPTRADYHKATRQNEPFDDLIEFTDGINNRLPDINRSDYLFDYVDLAEVINNMAGNTILTNHDRLTKNYYMYRDPVTDQWSWFPWDMDQAFARREDANFSSVLYGDTEHPQATGQPIYQNHLIDAILDTPATRQMYLRRLRTLVDEFLNTTYFEDRIDQYYGQIAADAVQDHRRWRGGAIDAGVRRLKENIAFRRRQLGADPLIPRALASGPFDIQIATVELSPVSGKELEQFVQIRNSEPVAVDVSGWWLNGARGAFPPGTVIPAGGSLFVARDVRAFRARVQGPSGGQGLFVQPGLERFAAGQLLTLTSADGRLIAQLTIPSGQPGDFDLDGKLTAADIHYFCRAQKAGTDPRIDLNGDGMANEEDRHMLVEQIFGTSYGDANLDGRFDSADLVAVFQAGGYENDLVDSADWTRGDGNCDGRFSSADLILAFQRGRYEAD